MRFHTTTEGKIYQEEMGAFLAYFTKALDQVRPDLMLTYGGGILDMALQTEAQRRGIPVIFVLANSNYTAYSFPGISALVTDSPGTAKFYFEKSRLNVQDIGVFIDPHRVVAEEHVADKICMVNVGAHKGLALLARLALMAQKKAPHLKFLIIENSCSWEHALSLLHIGDEKKTSATLSLKDFPNVETFGVSADMRPFYAQARVMLVPSLCFESFGMVCVEAFMNRVPVLASTCGNLTDTVGVGGITLDPPALNRNDWKRLPPEEEMVPWFEVLLDLWENKEKWQEAAQKQASQYNLETNTQKLIDCIEGVLQKRISVNPFALHGGVRLQ